jgi:deoxyribonuclease-4
MRIGAHVSVAGGMGAAVDAGIELGCEAIQVFVSNPRGWAAPPVDPDGNRRFRELAAAAGLQPVFIHAPYLVNFASSSQQSLERSAALVAATIERGVALGAAGVVVHAGSAMGAGRSAGIARTRAAVLPMLERAPGPDLLFELTSGAGDAVASRFEEMAELLDALERHPRIKVCFDTCHAHAAGYDLSTPPTATSVLDQLEATLGDRLALVHANDCADPVGTLRDHHARIGEGHIGLNGFGAMLGHPALADLPVVIETPGTPTERAADITRLRAMSAAALGGTIGARQAPRPRQSPAPSGARRWPGPARPARRPPSR